MKPTKLNYDLPKVVGMAAPGKEPLVANGRFVVSLPKHELLNIAHSLHDKPSGKNNNTSDVAARAKRYLWILLHIGRVQKGDRQRDGPNPYHLKDPEAQERKELVSLVIEAVIFARLQDPEEQESGEPNAPDHDEKRGNNLTRIMAATEGKRDDG